MLSKQCHEFLFKFVYRVPENYSGTNLVGIVVNKESRNTKGSHRQPRLHIYIVEVVVHIPVNLHIRNHVYLRIVQLRNFR